MSELTTKPRTTPMAGHRKATERFCEKCQKWHRTWRHILGADICESEENR